MIVPVFLPHLGCRERCIYCNQTYITDLRDTDIRSVIERNMSAQDGPFEVGLYGGNIFGIEIEQLQNLFAYFDPFRDRITGFRISTKPTGLTDAMTDILMANGVTLIELGIPSFNDDILAALNRRHTVQDLLSTYSSLRSSGFGVALQVMAGLPRESTDDIATTADHIINLDPDYVRIYPLVVIDGTPLGTMYKKGSFRPLSFDETLDRVLYIYLRATGHDIKVVRMGLTANEIIKEKVIAGHYHPAFGYMVKARAFYLAVMARLNDLSGHSRVTVRLNSRDVPHLLGHKRTHMELFSNMGISVDWKEDDAVDRDYFILEGEMQTVKGDIFDALPVLTEAYQDSRLRPSTPS